jgi:hypothetical protein
MSHLSQLYSLVPLFLLTVISVISPGCHRSFKDPVSQLNMADALIADQLDTGFYPAESNAWRWTMRKFSVLLKPPSGSERAGARLRLHLYISASQIQRLGPMTLSADAGGYSLAPETFSLAGPYIYTRDVPPAALDTNIVPVKFSFDKAAAPSETDARELAAVVSSVELQLK